MRLTHWRRGVLLLVVGQRLAEVVWAHRNERRLLGRGAVEHGAGHYPAMVALHTGWLAATAAESSLTSRADPVALGLYGLLQPLRYWVIRELGDRWTTRIYVVPGEPVVDSGPFRWLRHPNYVIVAAEIALLPVALGARRTAVVFSVLNAVLMGVRIPAEQAALSAASATPRTEPSTAPLR